MFEVQGDEEETPVLTVDPALAINQITKDFPTASVCAMSPGMDMTARSSVGFHRKSAWQNAAADGHNRAARLSIKQLKIICIL